MTPQEQIFALFGGVGALLVVATIAGRALRHRTRAAAPIPAIENLNARIDAWWGMVALIGAAFVFGKTGVIVLPSARPLGRVGSGRSRGDPCGDPPADGRGQSQALEEGPRW